MPKQREVVQAIEDAGLADVKVMIGGAPTTRKWAEEIGADGWAGDAITAAKTAKELMAAKRT
jgi:methanogenic corrinoid protein MtbC1